MHRDEYIKLVGDTIYADGYAVARILPNVPDTVRNAFRKAILTDGLERAFTAAILPRR